jgi:hypothetical protein
VKQAHNLEVLGSNPSPATYESPGVYILQGSRLSRPSHALRDDGRVELLGGQEGELERRLAQARALTVRGLGNLCRVIVPDLRVQGRHQYQGVLDVGLNVLAVRFDPHYAVVNEGPCRSGAPA